jgi:hypothetical protein
MAHTPPIPLLLLELAFVIHLCKGTDFEHGPATCRVEHVVSGRAIRSQLLEELVEFIARVLETVVTQSSPS